MNIQKLCSKLRRLSGERAQDRLENLVEIAVEADKRINEENKVYEHVSRYYKLITKNAFSKLKSKDKERCEKAAKKLRDSGCDEKYKQWENQVKAYKDAQLLTYLVRFPAEKFLETLKDFSQKYDPDLNYIDVDNGEIEGDKIPSGYKEKCIKECNREICEVFGVSSIAELKMIR